MLVDPSPKSQSQDVGLLLDRSLKLTASGAAPESGLALKSTARFVTVKFADAVPPVPPSIEVTLPVVLFQSPATMPFTLMEKVHELPWAKLVPDKLMTVVPWLAAIVPPLQLPVRPLGVDTTSPAGKVSLKPTPVSVVVVLLLFTVKLKLVEPFNGIEVGLKTVAMEGGATTVSEALEVLPVPALVEVTVTLLFFTPAVVPATVSDTVHDAPAAMLAPDNATDDEPSAAVAVPPQVLFRLPGVDTMSPAGKVSLKPTPVSVSVALLFCTIKLKLVEPFNGTLAAPNCVEMTGGATVTTGFNSV